MRPHTRPARTRHAPRRPPSRPPAHPAPLEDRSGPRPSDRGSSPGLTVELRSELVRPRLTVAGELDLASAGLLAAMLDHVRRTRGRQAAAGSRLEVDVDLAGVTFADSSGLAPVLDSRARIVAASVPVRRVLRLLAGAPQPAPSTA